MYPWDAAKQLGLTDVVIDAEPFGDGLIHGTWHVDAAGGPYLVQRMNRDVFPDCRAVAANAAAAADRVAGALVARGDLDPRHRIMYVKGPDGLPFFEDRERAVWRAMPLIEGARTPNPDDLEEVRSAAVALGRFPLLVAAGSGPEPIDVLPGFHDTPARLEAFRQTVEADPAGRLATCAREVDRLLEMAPLADMLASSHRRGDLPVRFVHNDAKIDNVLMDDDTGAALCVVDLDTVMPGLPAHDFGDLVRSAVTGLPEDTADLGAIAVRADRFEALAAGYLAGCGEELDEKERASLVTGTLVITYEQALRFLDDYLAGDRYYMVEDAEQNLRRARAQGRLLEHLLAGEHAMQAVVVRG